VHDDLGLWVPETPFISCGLGILMDQPAESIQPHDAFAGRWIGFGDGSERWRLTECAVRPVLVGLCCVWSAHGRLTPCPNPGSDRQGELVERDRHALVHWLLDRELVVPASQVLHQAMPSDDHPGAAILFEAPHQTKPCLQLAVIPWGARSQSRRSADV
jgi:hypothetical protein